MAQLQGKKELELERLKCLLELGEQAHLMCRSKAIDNEELTALTRKISEVDAQLAKFTGEGYFTTELTDCPNCHKPLVAGSVFCAECGFGVRDFVASFTRQCAVCGALAGENHHYCSVCGNQIQ